MRHTVRTPDGRLLAVEEHGDPTGRPILAHHGTPSSKKASFYRPWVRDAAARGIRLISYDRPGYGESSPRPGSTVADTAGDVRVICAELGIDRLATWGFSGGGPHVLACAALLPDLVSAAVALAGVAPYGVDGLDWFDGMYPDGVEDAVLYLTDTDAARKRMDEERTAFLAAPEDEGAGDEDAPGSYHRYLSSCRNAGLAPGLRGWYDDTSMQLQPWEYDLTVIEVPVLLMYGGRDIFVPVGHGEWLSRTVPGAEIRWFADEGHGTLAQKHVPEAHAWLAGNA